MSATRQRFNRFPPKDTIEWLDHDQRRSHRATIAMLTDLALTLEKGGELTPQQEAFILNRTAGSVARDTRLNAAWDLQEKTEEAYLAKLALMAPHDLTAYHELINPHEPPAHHHRFVCEHLMRVERGDLRTLIIALPPGAAKALTLDTPIPTPTGWTTMGELRVGDEVFDENGNSCRVTWKSPIWRSRPVYRVTTDCGDEIIADAEHEWPVQLCRKHPHVAIVETRDLTKKRSKRPMIHRAEALNLPEITLPLDPYLLGFWLGDGNSSGPRVTCSLEDAKFVRAEIERRGYETNDQSTALNFYIPGVRHILNSLGLLNDPHHSTVGRKHIPRAYLRASFSQRLDLLRGLVDSDGTVNARGETAFSSTNYELARAVQELVRSLGVKATMTEGRAKVNGKDCGAYYRVRFYMKGSALLPRKANKTRDAYRTINTYIDTTFAGFADTVCIEVDSPSHLFLCGESMTPTHNSTYSSRTFAQWCLGRNPDWRVLSVGHALALDTEVPTPTGFKTVKELMVGDYVYAPDGTPTRVIDKSPIYEGHTCFEVATSDGASVVVDENHKWTIQGYKSPKTTAELYQMTSAKALPKQEAVDYPQADLPIDPYVLGYWLGDGDSHGARITCGEQDVAHCIAEFTHLGYPTKVSEGNPHRVSVSNLHAELNATGLLKNKHVPEIYKTASIEQRIALVQGLMDADGDANIAGYTLTFNNTNRNIVDSFREILWSLGIKNTRVKLPATKKVINGKEYECAENYRVHFLFDKAFRIPRKTCKRNGVKNRLISVVPHESVPTQCITVDHPSHLFLVTRGYIPTHNSQKFVEDEFSKPNRTAIDSDIFRLAFPDVALNPAEKSASFWRLDGWRGSYACRGALAGTSGLRAKIVLADDLFKNAQDAMSSVVRENIWRWWTADVMSRRLPNAPTVLVNCLTAETPVLRADGSWTPISELKVGDDLWTYDKETGEPSVQVVEHWAEQPEDKIYEVHTGNGMVRCNGKHPFWARKYRYKGKWDDPCWINAEDLCVSDKVLHGGQREGSSEARLTEDEAWVLGLFFGDGCVSTGKGRAPWFCDQYITRLSVSNKTDDQQYIQQRINATFGIEFRFVEQKMTGGTSARFETNTVHTAKWLDARGIKIAGSAHTKRVPEWMFDQPRVIRQAFVDGLIHADGHRTSSGQLSITLCNEGLIRDLRTLLVGLGIKATTARRYEQYSTLPGREEKYHSVRYRVTYRDGNTYNDAFYWKGVTKVVDTKAREKVYDIQVSKTHNFVADHIVVSNTLWHSEDVPGRMKRLYEDNPKSVPLPFEFINIPAQAGTDDPLGREEGEWLWCADQQEDGFYTITDYLTKRSMTTPAMWSALYQGEPLDQQGEYIHEDQFQRYDRPPVNREGRKIEWTKTVMSVDCASKGKERSDYTAILIFRQGVDGLHYLVDVWRQKEPLETIIRTMSRMMRHWQVNYAIVEDSGMGAQILENYAGKMPSPMLPYVPAGKGSKDFRFDAAVPWITSGKILFPKNAPWLIEFINELVAFPNAANDDQADAFSQYTANELKFRKGGTRPLKVRI